MLKGKMSQKNNSSINKITIHEVAELAGVSTATVSRVLSDKGLVSDKLRTKVKKAIEQSNYRPNRAARNLRAGTVQRIGAIFSDISNPFFTSMLAGIEGALKEAGYVLIIGNTNEDSKVEQQQFEAFIDEGVAGIILASSIQSLSQYKVLIESGVPVIAIDRVIKGLKVDTVAINNFDAAKDATQYLLSLGHKRIAYIGGPEHISTAKLRADGYRRAMKEIGRWPSIVIDGGFKQSGGFKAVEQLLETTDRPTAILVGNNVMTLGALEAIHKSGVKIPGDIALVGFDDMPWATSLEPPLTVIAQPTYEMGEISAKLLLDRIKLPNDPIKEVLLETKLIIRESCGGLIKTGEVN